MTPRDPGLQPERTALAWQRTALSAAVVAILLLRTGVSHGSPLELTAAACALVMVATAWLTGRRPKKHHTPRPMLIATATAACATGLFALLELLTTTK